MGKLSPHINLGCKSCNKLSDFETNSNFKISKPQYKQTTIRTSKVYKKLSKKVTSLF